MSLFWKILVFDESTESADIATNENILLLDEYSKAKLFEYLLHWRFPKVVPMGAIVIRTRYDEGTESAEVATSAFIWLFWLHRKQIIIAPISQSWGPPITLTVMGTSYHTHSHGDLLSHSQSRGPPITLTVMGTSYHTYSHSPFHIRLKFVS
jgi:hypothetical protein